MLETKENISVDVLVQARSEGIEGAHRGLGLP